MKNLLKCELFKNIKEENLQKLLPLLNAQAKNYRKNESILLAGNPINRLGVVVYGRAHILREDALGEISIITELVQNDIFAEVLALSKIKNSPVTVNALENSRIVWLDVTAINIASNKIPQVLLPFYSNLLNIVAKKNLYLNKKIRYLSFRTTRQKIINFLFDYYKENEDKTFKIIFNRNQLAAFLCTNRSALSRELSKLHKEGLIDFDRNTFTLKSNFFKLPDKD